MPAWASAQQLALALRTSLAGTAERMRRGGVVDVAVAKALLSHAAGLHADLIVMVGQGHLRLR